MIGRWALFIAVAGCASSAQGQEVKTVVGAVLSGPITALDANDVTVSTEKGPVKAPLSQVLAVNWHAFKPASADDKFSEVKLLDETTLACQSVRYLGKEIEATLRSGATVKAPLAQVASVLRAGNDSAQRQQFEKQLRAKGRRDRILILREGELNPVEGTFGEIDPVKQTIGFEREDGTKLPLPLEKLAGLIFFHADLPAESAVCRVLDRDGSAVAATKLLLEGEQLKITTTFGTVIVWKAEEVGKLDFNLGRLIYLSDLEPAKVVDSPWLGGLPGMRKDSALEGGPLVVGERQYPKGLAMYANFEVEYALAGKYKEFRAVAGVDSRLAEEAQGKTTVSIYCDGKLEWSKEVSVKAPLPIQLSVKDAQTLRIVVRGPNATGYTAHATLADARVSQ